MVEWRFEKLIKIRLREQATNDDDKEGITEMKMCGTLYSLKSKKMGCVCVV